MNIYIVNKLYNVLISNNTLSESDRQKLKYSLEVIINEVMKIIALVTIFYLLGSLREFFYILFTLSILRTFSGGLHLKTFWSCLAFSFGFFSLCLVLASNISLGEHMKFTLLVATLLCVIIFAPVPAKTRPKHSKKKRYLYKLICATVITFHFLLSFFYGRNPYLDLSLWVITLQCIQILITKGGLIYGKKISKEKQ